MGLLVGAIAISFSGCASREIEIARERRSMDFERSPALDFFNSEVNTLFTNAQAFKAHLAVEPLVPQRTNNLSRLSGELWGRDGKLLFVPDPSTRRYKYSGAAGTSFIWNNSTRKGYAINGLLEGFAPLPAYGSTNFTPDYQSVLEGTEMIAGEVCQKYRVTSVLESNRTNTLLVWKAPSLSGFPIQIQSGMDFNSRLLKFSKVRFESVPDDVLSLPEGLTRYESVDAMLYELARREGETRGINRTSPDYPAGIPVYRK